MCLGDLAAEREADTGHGGLGGEERYEQVGRIRQARTLVFDGDLERAVDLLPVDPHLPAFTALERRVDRVPDDVDQQLFELVGIRGDVRVPVARYLDWQPILELGDAV